MSEKRRKERKKERKGPKGNRSFVDQNGTKKILSPYHCADVQWFLRFVC